MDELYMKRALELSLNGIGKTSPNPLVGAVIVKNGKIIGEGYHEYFGGPHAEVNAINNATEDVKGATIYVTLEPCSHYGKTPPCAELIVKMKLSKVVISMIDPNPKVAGRGVEILRQNGIEVIIGILKEEAEKTNEIFLKYIQEKKPFCILKTAMTMDGKIATKTGESQWITNEKSRYFVHELRNKVSGIMVGVNTIISDNPSLTTRLENGGTDAVRIIVDSSLRIPLNAQVLKVDSPKKTIIATTGKAYKEKLEKLKSIENVQVLIAPMKDSMVDLNFLFDWLGSEGIDSILVEGGSTLNFSILRNNLADKVITFISPKILGGIESKTPVGGDGFEKLQDAVLLKDIAISTFDEDIMIEAYVRKDRICLQD
ncbi:MAG: bifunctional diaminohydroxyphosphoribosylaminopyrimidine deaminase/5-amino-6-(5-phosphoribosylamino)uracil reductase RibD [Sedimentibacter sp.]